MLQGKKVVLRPLKASDSAYTILWRNNPEIKKMALTHPFPVTEQNESDWYKSILSTTGNHQVYFIIDDANSGEPVGYVFLKSINYIHGTCMLGIVIGNSTQQGKGYGSEAMALIHRYAFEVLNLRKISLEVAEYNHQAIGLYTKLGYIKEGHLTDQVYTENAYHSVLIYSLFRK